MSAYLARRIMQAVIVMLLVTVIIFVMLQHLPGGVAHAVLPPNASQAAVDEFNREHGLNEPLPVQYANWLGRVLRGDLGFSFRQNESVGQLLAERMPKTVVLAGLSLVFALLVAVPLGFLQAVRRNSPIDYAFTGMAFIFYSTPAFWLALILISLFALHWHLFPAQAPQGDIGAILSQPRGLVLPVLTISLVSIAFFSRYMRSSALENLTQDYVRTARAKGASLQRLLFRHVLRNALVPVVTLVGLSLPFVFAGTLISEQIFNYPGMGLLFYDAAINRDYPVLLGVTLVVGAATVVGSLLADVCYALLDPRIRYTRG